jgi:hypothetical protein
MNLSIEYYINKDNGSGIPRKTSKIAVQENDILIHMQFFEKR